MNKIIYYCEKTDKYTFFTLDEIKMYEAYSKLKLKEKLVLLASIYKMFNGLSRKKVNSNIKKIIALKILSEITQKNDLKNFYLLRYLEELNKCRDDKANFNKKEND